MTMPYNPSNKPMNAQTDGLTKVTHYTNNTQYFRSLYFRRLMAVAVMKTLWHENAFCITGLCDVNSSAAAQ